MSFCLFIVDLPDQLPSLTPAPPKKSRFKDSLVTFEDESPEARLDRHDTHISAVLSRIIVSAGCKSVALFSVGPLPVWIQGVFLIRFDVKIFSVVQIFVGVLFLLTFHSLSCSFFFFTPEQERDTSSTPISLPAFTGLAFPKVVHRSENSSQVQILI